MPTITFGADPEFLIEERCSGTFINADCVLKHPNTRATIGVDGCSCTGEMRIPPQTSFIKMFKVIKTLITKNLPNELDITKYDVTAGSGKFSPTGGHLHFGGIGASPSEEFLNNIYKFITEPLNEISNRKNREGCYGNKYDYERKSWGGFEARAPLSWIATCNITKGVFAISEIIANKGRNREIENWETLISYASAAQKRAIEKYQKEIKWFKEHNKTLEDVSVVKAWGKIKHISKAIKSYKAGYYPVAHSGDINLGAICGNPEFPMPLSRIRISIIGVGQNRDAEKAIYVPDFFFNMNTKMPTKFHGIPIKSWGAGAIGLTFSLRADINFCRFIVKNFIYLMNSFAKKNKECLLRFGLM